MGEKEIKIEASWKAVLEDEFSKSYFNELRNFIKSEIINGKVIYPPGPLIFNAFDKTPFPDVKVVVLGQDPYHGPDQAMGLSFSVNDGIKVPASLKRIYKELNRDINFAIPDHGNLSSWAKQGVFMLNAILTVEAGLPASHKKAGWHLFTDAVIKKISDEREGVVFMLWGNFAKGKKVLINTDKHFVLESAHPSPLAGNAFQGCGHFSKANEILETLGKTPIDWSLG
ncbi:uracil-DNA glycosylase [Portibacter lacus]|uniref:Uracil-DNA glycosylase n=1 Tax=Portibacter lacus TaxID=1099794 RepID=A0AA37SMX6_9BACT|nr:uracil-DNA glycosylase [Portibacter lacus]GLR15906.1 uracil-DNA glycosylase [Portibacter lacus]